MKNKNPIYVTRPSLPKLDEVIPLLEHIWATREVTNGGRFSDLFQYKLSQYLNAQNLSLYSNGTLALYSALEAFDLRGEVITTPYSFVATSSAILAAGLKPVYVDIEPDGFNIDPTKVIEAITPKTVAILAVHVYGVPCDVNKLEEIAAQYGLKLIFDAAHAFGAKCDCGKLLERGDASVLSFHATKVLTTFEGGTVVTKHEDIHRRLEEFKNFGVQKQYRVVNLGLNAKLNEFSCALGSIQLGLVDQYLSAREKIAKRYASAFKCTNGIRLISKVLNYGNHSYMPVIVGDDYPLTRDDLYERLAHENIYCRRYFYPLITDLEKYSQYTSREYKNARSASERVLCLPIYPDLDKNNQQRVIDLINFFAEKN